MQQFELLSLIGPLVQQFAFLQLKKTQDLCSFASSPDMLRRLS